ncbi:MAG: YgjP-like metallopeptidase domain-containing protein [Spongiibacteraceae bacterium]|jgi:predicted metal-dependent hydrolase
MPVKKYLAHYSPTIIDQVNVLIKNQQLAAFLLQRHPKQHDINNDRFLLEHVLAIKNKYMKKSQPLSKIIYDGKLHVLHNALGLHSFVSRVQGGKIKAKNEIRISSVFKKTSIDMLNMIAVHELAHLKEKDHNKAFYRLCMHMLPNYHQLEFEMRLYLIQLELDGSLYD